MYSIIGSGIAGLACSSLLSKQGVQNEVFEKNNKILDQNYGIQLSPNASYVLEKMGLLELLKPKLKIINSIEVCSLQNLKLITTLPIGNFVKYNNLTNYYTTSRNELYELLRRDVENSGTTINYKSEITKIDDNNQKVQLYKKDGKIIEKEKLIIANGNAKKSIYKNIIYKNVTNNFLTLRSNITKQNIPFDIKGDSVMLLLGKHLHIVIYPFFNNELNVVLITNKKYFDNNLKLDFGRIGYIDKKVFQLITECNWSSWQLQDRKIKLNLCPNKDIYAIGDAAHSIKPHLAQGSAMALEDAYFLTNLITNKNKAKDIHHMLKIREKRVNRVINKSSQNRYFFHAISPISIIRDTILNNIDGASFLNTLKWLYCYKI
tara:strand:+ start:241 stop:1368 length:1128 start_codon:yes stop_codon:yes gene_type:complete